VAELDGTAAFDALVGRLDPAMVVVTVAGDGPGGEVDGCLVGFHSQSSIDPRRYLVWLSVENRTYRLAAELGTTHLAVHLLSASDHDLAEHFGGRTGDDPEVDKLAELPWTAGPGGAPLIDALPERMVGRILERLHPPGNDHVGFLLEPVQASVTATAAEPPLRLGRTVDIEPGHPA
jgi:flavin reductase (DIM6/NTAB) family NADH-FMN oxidoreductase RutF